MELSRKLSRFEKVKNKTFFRVVRQLTCMVLIGGKEKPSSSIGSSTLVKDVELKETGLRKSVNMLT